ncbi:MAG: glucosaminidase domain-containing protein [Eubacteriales bacterium]|nr:glucosaminidase domain-containing protein [Eubacteriales bacterium]
MKKNMKRTIALMMCLCLVMGSSHIVYAEEMTEQQSDEASVISDLNENETEETDASESNQTEDDGSEQTSEDTVRKFVTMDGTRETEELYGINEDGSMYLMEEDEDAAIDIGSEGKQRVYASDVKIVNFRADANGSSVSSTSTTEYTEYGTGAAGYVCGAYGADAAYLGTSGGKVKFMISGVVGMVDASKVQVANLSSAKSYSCYKADGTNLYHYITTNMAYTGWGSVINVGRQPGYLSANTTYYSYDGHYFYLDYETMISDYQSNTRNHAVNTSEPYYNYYQYLPLRSECKYSGSELNSLISKYTSSGSKMNNTGTDFVTNQNSYGTNAILVAGLAANESGWGSSNLAQTKNNLFGLDAVDSNPNNAAFFSSITQCIKEFSETWCSKRYLRPGYTYYHGAFLGDKASGMNVSYASDPYWGEKAACHAWNMDKNGGSKDSYRYTIGIKDVINTSHTTVNVRKENSVSGTKLYDTGSVSNYAVLIRGLSGNFYEIQSDGVLNSERTSINKDSGAYSMEKMYAYISADYVKVVSGYNDLIDDSKEGVSYSVHAQTYGWMDERMDGQTAGTSGESKRLEALKLRLRNPSADGTIRYRTHCQTYGWLDWVEDGAVSGTSGESKRMEAIQIKLTGEMKERYDIYYRVHCQTYGWLDWAKNGEIAGTSGYGKRMEAIQIKLVEKNGAAPGATDRPNVLSHVTYRTHVQTYGWQDWKTEGVTSGTSGESKRLESIQIQLTNLDVDGSVEYRTHVQTYGWQDWKTDGQEAGTSGESKRLESIQIRLTGEAAEKYDVYYRVHAQTYGWLDWAMNGEIAGTTDLSKRLEAIEIRLIEKGEEAPGSTVRPYVQPMLEYKTYVQNTGWQTAVQGGAIAGTIGESKAVEALQVSLQNAKYSGSVEYKVYMKDSGWRNYVNNGATAGVTGQSKQIEAVRIQLTGQMANHYDIYYRVHSQGYGWLGWAKNGEAAGTEGLDKRVEAIQIILMDRGQDAPGTTEEPFISTTVQ